MPKQVLWNILDTVDACNESVQPFDDLKVILLGQCGKSKWQSYFELLRFPLDMQGLKHSIFMGKLKQSLPHGISPDNDLFLAMFLIRLPPSMREAVGSGNHKPRTPCGKFEAATTPRLPMLQLIAIGARLLLGGNGATRGPVLPVQKVARLPTKIF